MVILHDISHMHRLLTLLFSFLFCLQNFVILLSNSVGSMRSESTEGPNSDTHHNAKLYT